MKIAEQDRAKLTIHSLASVDFKPENIPHELKVLKQWVACYLSSPKRPSPKVPIGGPTKPHLQTSFKELQADLNTKAYQHFGICLREDDDIVCIDVDHLKENFSFTDLPERIQNLLEMRPTYVEISPSGRGLHIYYKTNKALLAHHKHRPSNTKGFKGEVFLSKQFVTVTGHIFPKYATPTIAEIDATLFEDLVFMPAKVTTIKSAPDQRGLNEKGGIHTGQYSFSDIERWLNKIPPNLSESALQPAIHAVYEKFDPPLHTPTDYMHWQYIAAMVHWAAADLGDADSGEELFVDWSLTGDNEGEANIRQKYLDNAPKYDGNDLTYLSLVKMANSLKPIWPYPIMIKPKGQNHSVPTNEPMTNVLINWQELVKFFQLTIQQNEVTKVYRVSGPDQTTTRYFSSKEYESKEELQSAILYFGQLHGMSKATPQPSNAFTQWWVTHSSETYNPIKEWISNARPLTPAEKKVSWFQALWETLELHPHDAAREPLYRSYLKKNLMGLIRAHFYTGQYRHSTGVVILYGGEGSRKSSWVVKLLPPELEHYIFPSQADITKNKKELGIEAASCAIWLKDEIDGFLKGDVKQSNKNASIKSFFVQSDDAYRPLFGKQTIKVPRKCIFFGTTNEPQLSLSGTGNRRIQIIPVKYCHTDKLDNFPIVKVYQELLAEFNALPVKDQPKLWVLDETEIGTTNKINTSEHNTETTGDIILKELYDFSVPFDIADFLTDKGTVDKNKLLTATAVFKNAKSADFYIARAAVRHSLKRVAGFWTDTIKGVKVIEAVGNWSIEHGQAKYRDPSGNVKFSGYMMPPLKATQAFDELKPEKVE